MLCVVDNLKYKLKEYGDGKKFIYIILGKCDFLYIDVNWFCKFIWDV